jgi:tungstate transport system substrate-binding protein
MKKKIAVSFFIFLMVFALFVGLVSATETIKLATTTSTENSGLLGVLLPPFEEKYGIKVDVISVGTGAAIQQGKIGRAHV